MLRLPINLRDVFVLHRFGGLNYDEIRLHLGMTPEAVQAALAAALARLVRAVRITER
ncbi:sigma factor-like helix-turn-helix DNA-binding protein [Brevundimonas sp.]|uniref:sigma factor-like helix-turn-helix DNA-binding protein n=1 Tax=Brevundimonas sp. TaxID=1871086 RepID=UPI0025C32670|nr:sigma factor-like helix-turn-helix DNA-binding protein [Brevundimonas sp.]